MIDSHTHLNLEPLYSGYQTYFEHAKKHGIERLMIVGTDLHSSEIALQLAKENSSLWASVGIHPEESGDFERIRSLANDPKVSAIGECGLDYFRSTDHDRQKNLFLQHVTLANERALPLIIHCRNAYDDLLPLLKQTKIPRFVLHCVSGPIPYIQEALALGAYLSFAGNVTYPSAQSIRDILAIAPLERILVETDAPFLAPQSHRGQTNEPAFVMDTARYVANFLHLDLAEFDRISTANARTLFG